MKYSYTPPLFMRTNPLSAVPGGSTVTFVYYDEYSVEYTNIKHVPAYIQRVFETSTKTITKVLIDGTVYWEEGVI